MIKVPVISSVIWCRRRGKHERRWSHQLVAVLLSRKFKLSLNSSSTQSHPLIPSLDPVSPAQLIQCLRSSVRRDAATSLDFHLQPRRSAPDDPAINRLGRQTAPALLGS